MSADLFSMYGNYGNKTYQTDIFENHKYILDAKTNKSFHAFYLKVASIKIRVT